MEPFTAVGLAGNIVQFVDFTLKVITGAHDLYTSTSGSTNAELEARDVVEHIQKIARLATPRIPLEAKPDIDLVPLSNDCNAIANELIKLINSVQLTTSGAGRLWQSVYKAGQRQWKEKQIADLQKRLDRVGNLICNFMVIHQQGTITTDLKQLRRDVALMNTNTTDLSGLLEEFTRVFKTVEQNILQKDASNTLASSRPSKMDAELPRIVSRWFDIRADQHVLRQLRFYAIDDRSSEISVPIAKTYQWILEDSRTDIGLDQPHNGQRASFAEWLASEDSMYWITGKPGSGKSTMMKYLSTSQRTVDLSRAWTDGHQVSVASFFFWNSTKERLQKSETGLLRALLYQLLAKWPGWLRVLFPDIWDSLREGQQVSHADLDTFFSSSSRLRGALQRLMTRLKNEKTKLIFFIDGLDEYEGKPSDIVNLITGLSTYHGPALKICLASRPWIEFEDAAFGKNNPWKLELHNFTDGDIAQYVKDLLGENKLYKDLLRHDYRCPDLVQAIARAARGTFLWVKLVVTSLLEGLTNSDRVVDLLHRLHEMPTDLNEFFQRMLDTVDHKYHQDTARFLLVALEAQIHLPLMVFWHIHEADASFTARSAIFTYEMVEHDVSIEFVDEDTSAYRLEQMRRRLISRCKGLLEVAPTAYDHMKHLYYGGTVDFLHRTVRDFLQRPHVRQRLEDWAGEFDMDEAICKGLTTQIRLTPLFQNPNLDERWPPRLIDCMLWHSGHLQAKGGALRNEGVRHATEFFKILKAHAVKHKNHIESYFQGTDLSHSDPADPSEPFDRGTLAARLRLTQLFFPDFELYRVPVARGRVHPAWKRPSSSERQGRQSSNAVKRNTSPHTVAQLQAMRKPEKLSPTPPSKDKNRIRRFFKATKRKLFSNMP
jgi:hypothetical protein